MIYHILFWTLCAVLAAHVVVAVIAIIRAYRHEGRLFFSKPAFQNGRNPKGQLFLDQTSTPWIDAGETACSRVR